MGRPLLLAHRGHRAAGPENSLRAVVAAFEVADGAEVDVLVTADGRAVLRHDERLADGAPVRAFTLDALRKQVRADPDDLPEIGAVLGAIPASRGTLNVELKVPGAARALAALDSRWDRVVFTSFFAAEVMDARSLFPGRPAGLLTANAPVPFVPPGVSLLSVRQAVLGDVRSAFPDATLWAWTVNDRDAAERARIARCEAVIGDDATSLRLWFP